MSPDAQVIGVAIVSAVIIAGWGLWAWYFLSGAERRDAEKRKKQTEQ